MSIEAGRKGILALYYPLDSKLGEMPKGKVVVTGIYNAMLNEFQAYKIDAFE